MLFPFIKAEIAHRYRKFITSGTNPLPSALRFWTRACSKTASIQQAVSESVHFFGELKLLTGINESLQCSTASASKLDGPRAVIQLKYVE